MAAEVRLNGEAPDGYRLHTESSSSILIPLANGETGQKDVFLNPAQEYNRDLSVVAIRIWSELVAREDADRKERARQRKAERPAKRRKVQQVNGDDATSHIEAGTPESVAPSDPSAVPSTSQINGSSDQKVYAATHEPAAQSSPKRTFTCFEALAASGLRSIRYAKEIPLLRWVIANDLSASAVKSIHEHVALNGLTPEDGKEAKVRPQQGDCTDVMYAHRSDKKRFDVIDLDPYGTAAPFLDAAVQSISDGGLLCVTCTDMAVLAGAQYPEKAFSNYGGVAIKAEFAHEVALRLVLNAISSSAIRYGRHITPVLSLSIDFYVRLFVRVWDGAAGAKKASTATGIVYVCHGCHNFHIQPLARLAPKTPDGPNATYRAGAGPPTSTLCDECGSTHAIGGPLWLGPLHDRSFVAAMLQHVNEPGAHYRTVQRLRGMLSVAQSELETPFYVVPAKLGSVFHCSAPSLSQVGSALLRAGHDISRSHAMAGSIKTDAPLSVVHDVMRAWVTRHPVVMSNIKEGNPARALLAKPPTLTDVNFELHDDVEAKLLTNVKILRYEHTPPGHGPIAVARGGKGRKRRG